MTSFLDIEQAAQRLRRNLRVAARPDLRLLCGLEFFRLFADEGGAPIAKQAVLLETYLREFIPALAIEARRCDPRELFPDEAVRLGNLIAWAGNAPDGTVAPDDLAALAQLYEAVTSRRDATEESLQHTLTPALSLEGRGGKSADSIPSPSQGEGSRVRVSQPESEDAIVLNGLFVEENPDLRLEPRGRILQLRVAATPISGKVKDDDIVIRNPTARPDDPFRQQAQIAVTAARRYLARRYGLSDKKRYRFDFEVLSAASALSGPSLGMPFAVGAMAALARTEALRDRLTVPLNVAFSGALGDDGRLVTIDSVGLRRKIERAFHSDVGLLVIPRDHLSDAWEYVAQLETQHPGRKLDLVGADTLESVVNDPRLLVPRRLSLPLHIARKSWRAKRSAWVEVPGLVVLAGLLFGLVAPAKWMPWFDWNPASLRITANGVSALNARGQELWGRSFPCPCIDTASRWVADDIDHDGKRELAFLLATPASDPCSLNAMLYMLDDDGDLLFHQSAVILGEYPGDTSLQHWYTAGDVDIFTFRGAKRLMTVVTSSFPARAHFRFWSLEGEPAGWYVNAGFPGIDIRHRIVIEDAGLICLAGYNNRMDGAAAFYALPIDSASGCSPPYADTAYDLSRVRRGNQSAYVVFPRTDLSHALRQPYSSPTDLRTDPGGIIITVAEGSKRGNSELWFTLDRSFRVSEVRPDDYFWPLRDAFVAQGTLPHVNRQEYLLRLLDSVMYWTDSGWVTEGQLRLSEAGR